MRRAHCRNRRDDVHHGDGFAAEECAVMIHVGREHDFRAPFDDLIDVWIHFGASRIAPSRRITSPLSIWFSAMCRASAAYSSAFPSRAGNGVCFPSDSRAASGNPAIIGVSKIPGAILITRIWCCANSRAIASVIPTTPPLEAEYAA